MTDAELMTTAPDVPIVEVREMQPSWQVHLSGTYLGTVQQTRNGIFIATHNGKFQTDIPTRNAAVQWILDQHKGGQQCLTAAYPK